MAGERELGYAGRPLPHTAKRHFVLDVGAAAHIPFKKLFAGRRACRSLALRPPPVDVRYPGADATGKPILLDVSAGRKSCYGRHCHRFCYRRLLGSYRLSGPLDMFPQRRLGGFAKPSYRLQS